MADDHAVEAVSSYGSYLSHYAKTPNIDRIGREGMRFTNCCCNNSICSPSRATFLTGQYSHKNGVLGLGGTINDTAPWFSTQLQQAGYQTCVVGKWHLGNKPKGFSQYWVTKGQGKYFNPTFNTPDGIVKKQGYSTDVYTDTALQWLKQRDTNQPFCLCLHFKAPHAPYDYPERHKNLLEGVKVVEPENLHEDIAKTSPMLKNMLKAQMDARQGYYDRMKNDKDMPQEHRNLTDHRSRVSAAYQHLIKKYIRCITANDDNVKRVLNYLDNQGLTDNTIVIYTSDQGYWLGQHGLYDKRLILEESLKMPLLVRYPKKIKPGSVNDKLVMNIDFAPTFLDYGGARIPEVMQGRSLRPLLQGKDPGDWRDAIFYCYWGAAPTHWGVRSDRYKLVRFPQTDEIEFYDLKRDPTEMHNVAKDPKYAKAIAKSRKQLARLIQEVDIQPEQFPKYKAPGNPKNTRQRKKKQ